MDRKQNSTLHAATDEDRELYGKGNGASSGNGRLKRFLQELSQRKVCRAAITYSLVLWLNLQIADVMFPVIGLPAWTLKFVMYIGFMGFPVVLLLAWTFQVTGRGIELDIRETDRGSLTDRYLDRIVSLLLLVLSLILTGLLAAQFLS